MAAASSLNINTCTEIRPAEQNGIPIGKGLFATTAIKKGDDILTANTPLVALLEEKQLKKVCSGCFDVRQVAFDADESDLVKACTRCKVVCYCDKKCQVKDWRAGHQFECPIYAKLLPRVLPTNVRAILRILLRYKKGKITKEEYDTFLDLGFPPIPSEREAGYVDFALMAKAVKEYGGFDDLETDFIASLFARLNVNSFTLTSAFGNRRGIYLHPYIARFNHSCDYNAAYSFHHGECYIKAIRPIEKDEQIFISYIDTTYSVGTRRGELLDRYKFECQCSKCIHEIETISSEEIENRSSEEQNGNKYIDDTFRVREDNAFGIAWDLGEFIRKIQEKLDREIVNTQQQPLAAIRYEIMAAKISTQQWESAVLDAAIRHLRTDPAQFPDENHPTRREHAIEFVQCTFYAHEVIKRYSDSEKSDHVLVRHKVVLPVVMWSVMDWVVNGSSNSTESDRKQEIVWTNPILKAYAIDLLQNINKQLDSLGIEGTRKDGLARENWEKMEAVVREVLEQEKRNE